jgi:hypothetical protein
VYDDLRLVRFRGGFLTCRSSDLAGTAALLRARPDEPQDVVGDAIDLHVATAAAYFEHEIAALAEHDDLRVAAAVLQTAVYGARGPAEPLVQVRADVARLHHVQPTTVIGYENRLFRHLSGLVYAAGRRLTQAPQPHPGDGTSDHRRLLRRTERALWRFLTSWEPVVDDVTSLHLLGAYLSFADSFLAEMDDGSEVPFLRLKLAPQLKRDYWSDDDQLNTLVRPVLSPRLDSPWLSSTELGHACRATRFTIRGDPALLELAVRTGTGGSEILDRWGRIVRHDNPGCRHLIPPVVESVCAWHDLLRAIDEIHARLRLALPDLIPRLETTNQT